MRREQHGLLQEISAYVIRDIRHECSADANWSDPKYEIFCDDNMYQFKRTISLSVMLLLAGCQSLPEMVQRSKIKNMTGKPIEVAFAELGPYAAKYPIPSGTVYEWNSYRENVRNELVEAYVAPGPNGLTQHQLYDDVTYRYKCVIQIFVDKSTKPIADHTVEGNDCKAW